MSSVLFDTTRAVHERTPFSHSRRPAATLGDVAKEIAIRTDLDDAGKVRILVAIVRAMNAPPAYTIQTIDDVTWLTLNNPDEFERLLRAYWLLRGKRMLFV
jgi:hypothetical protein